MKFKFLASHGFTVVELMLAITIAGIITGAIGTFLMVHIRSFETTKDIIDIQYEGQLAYNALSERAMESKGIDYVSDITDVVDPVKTDNNTMLLNPTVISFIDADDSIVAFQYIAAEKKIVFKEVIAGDLAPYDLTSGDWYDFALNVDSWSISPGVSKDTYELTTNVYVSMIFRKGGAEITLSNLFKFRNKVN